MHPVFVVLLSAWLLGGCASSPSDPSGIWINQAAIDAATEGGNLREALLAYGPNLEWQIDSQRRLASVSNGFELGEGQLQGTDAGRFRVDFYGDYQEYLNLDAAELVQVASANWPEQRFVQPTEAVAAGAPPGSSFEQALYRAYLGGTWTIIQGVGEGGLVRFNPDGQLQGLPGAERYALCLAGDCAAMGGESDSLWLQLGEQGNVWLFERDGEQLRIFAARNTAQVDEMPNYRKGPQRWLLERD